MKKEIKELAIADLIATEEWGKFLVASTKRRTLANVSRVLSVIERE